MREKLATFAKIQQEIIAKVKENPSDCELIRQANYLADVLLPRSAKLPTDALRQILFLKTQLNEIHLRNEAGCHDLEHLLEVYGHINSLGD